MSMPRLLVLQTQADTVTARLEDDMAVVVLA